MCSSGGSLGRHDHASMAAKGVLCVSVCSPCLPQHALTNSTASITWRDRKVAISRFIVRLLFNAWLYLNGLHSVLYTWSIIVCHLYLCHFIAAFEEAEKNAPSIIFIDEIDAIAPKRDKVLVTFCYSVFITNCNRHMVKWRKELYHNYSLLWMG